MPPRQWVDQNNNVAQFAPVRHEHSPAPLCGCGHPAEKAIGTPPARCGVFRCTCTRHPTPDWTLDGPAIDWIQIGRDAHANGEPGIPALNQQISEALIGMPVGGDAADIMRQFLEGWNAANAGPVETATAIGVADSQLLIKAALQLYDDHGDVDGILSDSQIETIERLRPEAGSPIEELALLDPWDVVSIAVTARELADRHHRDDERLREAIERARVHLDVGDDDDHPEGDVTTDRLPQ
ncbi:hypothetical protein [Nocardia sp. NPDC047038]|uniref:hypothetical protein n=1 Tax=Nocardia sp. NPDC047038 TaxID=3154338 RepID=UPI0033D6E9FF